MKVSKLFHWLYAILMLLPFAFFVPSIFYYAFNDNSVMQTVEVPKTETISVSFNQISKPFSDWGDYLYVSTLTLNDDDLLVVTNNASNYVGCGCSGVIFFNHHYLVKCDVVSFSGNNLYFNFRNSNRHRVDVGNNEFIFITANDGNEFGFYNEENIVNNTFTLSSVQIFDLTQMFGSGNEPTINEFNSMFPNDYYDYVLSQPMQITYDTGETMELVENTSIVNYAWESIWDLPLFSWTKVTFIAVPFTYITGLFGLASTNSINYVFGYFLSISIVWLVFDIIMYVPLLCHRWIDKARLE